MKVSSSVITPGAQSNYFPMEKQVREQWNTRTEFSGL